MYELDLLAQTLKLSSYFELKNLYIKFQLIWYPEGLTPFVIVFGILLTFSFY